MNRTITYPISPENDGVRIRSFLYRRGYSRQNLIELKKDEGCVTVNGLPARFCDFLRKGDLLEIHIREHAPSNAAPVKLPVGIVYEDEDILVVNKPAGMPVHPSFHNRDNTLANALAWHYKDQDQSFVFRCSNRLDRDTSGLTIVSRHHVSAAIISEMGHRHEICREYLALASGIISEPEGTITVPLGKKSTSLIERCADPAGGMEAVTHYRVLSRFPAHDGGSKEGFTLVQVRLETGRTHQIRVHMQSIGHPLLGDPLYGLPLREKTAPAIQRQALHAYRLGFDHPITGKKLSFEAPMPEDMQQILCAAQTL